MTNQDISEKALSSCISVRYEPVSNISSLISLSCDDINHIYHNFLKGHILAGSITQQEALRALSESFMICGEKCDREELYTTLAELLNIEIL